MPDGHGCGALHPYILGTGSRNVRRGKRFLALPQMKKEGAAWIVNIASLAGRNYFATAGAYCASKAGLVAFSESLMLEVRDAGIRVTVIMPGSVATDFSGERRTGDDSWKLQPDDVAQVVVDLLRHPSRSLPSKVEMRPSKTK